jgi:hypothetical protein
MDTSGKTAARRAAPDVLASAGYWYASATVRI